MGKWRHFRDRKAESGGEEVLSLFGTANRRKPKGVKRKRDLEQWQDSPVNPNARKGVSRVMERVTQDAIFEKKVSIGFHKEH